MQEPTQVPPQHNPKSHMAISTHTHTHTHARAPYVWIGHATQTCSHPHARAICLRERVQDTCLQFPRTQQVLQPLCRRHLLHYAVCGVRVVHVEDDHPCLGAQREGLSDVHVRACTHTPHEKREKHCQQLQREAGFLTRPARRPVRRDE